MFYDVFEELCTKKNISKKRAAEEIGLSNSITTKWKKTGATPSTETLKKIADYFSVSIEYLIGEKEEEAASSGHSPYSEEDIKWLEMFRNASPSKRSAILVLLGQENGADPGAKD